MLEGSPKSRRKRKTTLAAQYHRNERSINMGSSQSSAPSRILLLGIDGAGKTSLLNKHENPGEAQEQVQPTDGFIVKDVKVKGVKLSVWDVAGKEATRSLWKHYYEQGITHAIIWVVDSADTQARLEESRAALTGALLDPHLQGTLYFSTLSILRFIHHKALWTPPTFSSPSPSLHPPLTALFPPFPVFTCFYSHSFILLAPR